jgi:hypothetical protein
MKFFILLLELAAISGADGFSLRNVENYVNISRYQGRKYLSELIELKWITRRANRFYVTSHGSSVYDAMLGGQRPIFGVEEYQVINHGEDLETFPF